MNFWGTWFRLRGDKPFLSNKFWKQQQAPQPPRNHQAQVLDEIPQMGKGQPVAEEVMEVVETAMETRQEILMGLRTRRLLGVSKAKFS